MHVQRKRCKAALPVPGSSTTLPLRLWEMAAVLAHLLLTSQRLCRASLADSLMGLERRSVPVTCTTHGGPASTAKRQERSGGAGTSPGYFHSAAPAQPGGMLSAPSHHPPGLGTTCSQLLHRCMTEQHVHPCCIHLPQHPLSPALPLPASVLRHIPAWI